MPGILVATDGSRRSLTVLPHAARLAEVLGEELRGVRVLSPGEDHPGEGEAQGITASVVRARPEEAVADAILRAAIESGARVVAMHASGAGGASPPRLGHVVEAALRNASLPLLVTGEGAGPPGDVRMGYRILVTTDGSPDSLAALPVVAPWSERGLARLVALRVYTPASGRPGPEAELESAWRSLDAFAQAGEDGAVECHVEPARPGEDVASVIGRAAIAHGVDALAMATHGSGRGRAAAGSTALAVVSLVPLPVLLCPPPRAAR